MAAQARALTGAAAPAGVGHAAALGLITLLAAALRSWGLGAEPLWNDEAFSWWWSQQPLAALWGEPGRLETNPPLYYTLQHLVLRLADSEAALRSVSALAGIATVPLTYAVGRIAAGRSVGLVAALLVATAGAPVAYSQEARGYALLGLAGTVAVLGLLLMLRGLSHPRPPARALAGAVLYALGTTLALYTHNTAALLPLLANALALSFWLLRRPRHVRPLLLWLGANLVPFLLWLGWLPTVLQQAAGASSIAWIDNPSLPAAIRTVAGLYGPEALGTPWGFLVWPVLALAAAGLLLAWPPRAPLLVLAVFVLGVPALTWTAGLVGRPLWLERVLFWPVPLGFVLIAAGLAQLRSRTLARTTTVALVALQLLNLAAYHATAQKPPLDRIASILAERRAPGDALLLVPGTVDIALAYYLRRHGLPLDAFAHDPTGAYMELNGPYAARPLTGALGSPVRPVTAAGVPELLAEHDRVWVLFRRRQALDPDGRLLASLARTGRIVEQQALPPLLDLVLVERGSG